MPLAEEATGAAPVSISGQAPRCKISGSSLEHSYGGRSVTIPGITPADGRVFGISCARDHVVVLSQKRIDDIRIISSALPIGLDEGVDARLESRRLRIDLGERFENGIAGWTHSDDAAFVLTRDGLLHSVALQTESRVESVHMLERSRSAQMAYGKGLLFILYPERKLMAISPGDWRFGISDLPIGASGQSIRKEDGRIILDDSFEILAHGMPGSIRIIAR